MNSHAKMVFENTNYNSFIESINELLNIHHQNYQKLLRNKKIRRKITYFGNKKNKFLYEHINHPTFNKHLTRCLFYIYKLYSFIDVKENLFLRLSENKDLIKKTLKEKQIFVFKELLNGNKCQKIINDLNHKKFLERNENSIKSIDLTKNNNNKGIWWIHDVNDLLQNVLIQQIMSSSYLIEIAQDYLGCRPILHNVQFWVSYPGDIESTQEFHQDFDDIKFLKVFIYLNDVNENNGPHCYVQNSLHKAHKIVSIDDKLSQRYHDTTVENEFKEDILYLKGKKGTMIIEDTHGLHKGTQVKKGNRIILQLLYGCSTYYPFKTKDFSKFDCNVQDHAILYKAFLRYPYSFMNFNFRQ